ncbi:uncharacterized protein N7496_008821 [Penicillium cataractarum]|uniref:Uncharacterized protein n=1 Tax=Penicillium cataractarum TaxID=2100454 RepID=A0A9W9RZ60_9EURO|nr:uncharacterized protein N7496_008821 [Penicillium cataractarum]KAJ5369061.1 hypothetical protein N7496_008821 [Penicillium cataractarum]
MMVAWRLSLPFLAAEVLANTALAAHPYPLGVSFGQRNITAAVIDDNGSPLLLANIAGTNAYRQMMRDSIDYEGLQWESDGDWYFSNGSDPVQIPEPGNKLLMEAIFLENLVEIRQVATQKLGYALDMASIVYPRHLNDTAREIFQKVVIGNEPGLSTARQLGDSYDGAFRAYDFHLGESDGLVGFVDYDDEYVDQAVGKIAKDRAIWGANGCNLRFRGMARQDGASRITDNDTERAQKINELGISLGDTIEVFANMQGTGPKGLILSGEGPQLDFKYLRESIAAAVPDHADKICDSIDPTFVGAVGAAKWAKFQVDHADTFFNEPAGHDEL